ncbi:MAG: zf-TFIIB domain-containing protein [Acidobacteriales bacterium]|nr:zf-TFIIB domain-containing protein [Terriglobales bacterium]
MNCVSCGGSMRLEPAKECLICNYCGNIVFPEPDQDDVRVFGKVDDSPCPVCRIPLFEAVLAHRRILYCQRCRGMLVSMDDFLPIIVERRAESHTATEPAQPPEWDDMNRSVLCPQCGELMDTHPYGGPGAIIIDNCPRCRLNWLDHKELARITTAPDGTDPREWSEPAPSGDRISLPPRGAFFEQQPPQATQVVQNPAAGGDMLRKTLEFIRHQLQRLFVA